MTPFNLLLLTNSLTLVAAVTAAVKWPVWSYRLVAGVAVCAFIAALHQVVTGRSSPLALLLTTLLAALIAWRAVLNARRLRARSRR